MARPLKKGIAYFPLDVDFFEDDKVEYITARFDEKGELIVIKLLCAIYRNGYYTDWNNDKQLIFAKRAGKNVSPSLVNDVVTELVKRGFFDKGIFNSFGLLTSKGIQTRYLEAVIGRKNVDICLDYWLIDVPKDTPKTTFNVSPGIYFVSPGRNEVNPGRNPAKKRKVNNKTIINNISAHARGDSTGKPEPASASAQSQLPGLSTHSEAIQEVQRHYEQSFAGLVSSTAVMQIIDFLDAGLESALICRAIDESVNAGARNWVYARSILDACVTKGLLTLSQYTLSEANRRAYKARQNGGITSGYDSAGTAYAPSGGELGAAVGGDTDELREGFKRQSDKWRRKAD